MRYTRNNVNNNYDCSSQYFDKLFDIFEVLISLNRLRLRIILYKTVRIHNENNIKIALIVQ